MSDAKPKKTVFFATGGSGGHIFPGLAMASVLREAGYTCVFIGHGKSFVDSVTARGFAYLPLPASPWNVRNPFLKLKALALMAWGFWVALGHLRREKPGLVLGMGGYSTVAVVLAAVALKCLVALHEPNALPGRANTLLSRWAARVYLSFATTQKFLKLPEERVVICGNPVRDNVLAAAKEDRIEDGTFRLLVTGGSQGARILNRVIPAALTNLNAAQKKRLRVVHQSRFDDVAEVKKAYTAAGVQADVSHFYTDLPYRMRQAHLVISRAGAGSVAEVEVLGRAALFVPLRLADGHQKENARVLVDAHAALMLEEPDFTPDRLARDLGNLMQTPSRLADMEHKTAMMARPDAAAVAAFDIRRFFEGQNVPLPRHLEQRILDDAERA
jgi:UDP-N-acetylglucosamine--N-acetylmuramyl-(pentapeptide) pyrophosphoryl-undecaprenol N-acetylglucosamine transferase